MAIRHGPVRFAMGDELYEFLQVAIPVLALVAALAVTAHAALTRPDPRTALGWIGLAWLSPLVGAALYLMLGVNLIARRRRTHRAEMVLDEQTDCCVEPETLLEKADVPSHLESLARATEVIGRRPLVPGCRVALLDDGDEVYPAMLEAIASASRFIGLMSYIFEAEGPGEQIVDALVAAKERGVEVRVLVDAAGERYARRRVTRLLRKRGVKAARFMPAYAPWRWPYMNLRNHRKVLVIDGVVAFAGGINIRPEHIRTAKPHTRDVHARFEGPVVTQLVFAFREDWLFATGERLAWVPSPTMVGSVVARTIFDGPDEDLDRARSVLLAAIATARTRIAITTPYFLPDPTIAKMLQTAARRGVRVDVVLPSESNLRLVSWAMEHALSVNPLSDVNLWRTPRPFDHSKLMVVDDAWSFIGSANWDPRSLRLNFELNVECYDRELGKRVAAAIDERIANAKPHSPVEGWRRVRNALVGLLQPYL